MTIRTFTAALALAALSPIAAQAQGPDVVYYDDNIQSTGVENRGRYIIDGTPGQSDSVCFTQQQGHYSLGTDNGVWFLFFGANCTGAAQQLGAVQIPLDPRTTGEISCEPRGITVDGLNSDFIGGAGDYLLADTTGDSQELCWNQLGGNNSVGKFYGHWMVVTGHDCAMPTSPAATIPLGQGDTCDPTARPSVDVYLPPIGE